jgi:hypothetical protein
MKRSKKFDPIVIICPWLLYKDDKSMFSILEQVEVFCKDKNYTYINTYDKETKKWLDIKKKINPNIVFFTYPYPKFTRKEYRITNFLKTSLTCYATYGFNIDGKQQRQFNLLFHNVMWKGFYETPIHKMMAQKYAINKGMNVEVSGYPLFDEFVNIKLHEIKDVWKIKNRNIKRIIWAPHHTIDNLWNETQFSCFLSYASFMFEVAEKYKNKLQIAFKPHPKLKEKLYLQPNWGKVKTDTYYKQWANLDNGQLEEGEYSNLFLTSDAMILDSISFICEYLYTKNPLLFTMKSKHTKHNLNEFGEIAFQKIYHSHSQKEIEIFINETVLKEDDPMKAERIHFFNTQLLSPNNVTASQNILNYITSKVEN